MASFILASVRSPFRAVVETVAPRSRAFGPDEWVRAESLVDGVLSGRARRIRRQLVLFLRVLDLLPLLRYGRRFSGLDPERRLTLLQTLERSRILAIRRGVWGVRTLGWLAVYGQTEVQDALGYRPMPEGWAARPDALSARDLGAPGPHPS